MNTFTDQVKYELIQKQPLQEAELAGLMKMNGSVQINKKVLSVRIKVPYGDLARKIYTFLKKEFAFELEIVVRQDNNFSTNYSYELIILSGTGIKEFLVKMGLLDNDYNLVYRIIGKFKQERDQKKSYLKGVFLAAGSVNDPHGEYHLELRCAYNTQANELLNLLADLDLPGHRSEHKSNYVIYLKRFAKITAFLNIVGAYNSQLHMENIHTLKEIKNNINRKVNVETANLDKTVKAAMRQLADINLIENNQPVEFLPKSLQEIARLRKKNPYASFKELGKLLNPPLSKSGVNHRMRRLQKLAENIRSQ